uniref:D-aspartate oxidase-like n=1 Tax=Crassostrea virginica TaxID=6565 RepID=A0A8B8ESB5_CRAVI|nr:D-aspartate oxidase-like [Crassostrea virginica]XP_022342649.1 D-aspartate oxidase-like [Crassostrea virginica]XP_022342650.1 D-aspartate oxidase-like [Crassostrea virginica]
MARVVVIGAGVVGLSTAVNIQRQIPACHVTIVAEDIVDGTTSVGAGAIFRPTADYLPGVDKERAMKWIRDGWEHFSSIALSEHAGPAGLAITPSFMLSRTEIKDPLYKDVVFTFHELSKDEMRRLGFNQHFNYGYLVTTIVITTKIYLAWLLKGFQENGGIIEKKRVSDINEFQGRCDVLVNCSALGSRELFGDKNIYPNRGQLLRVKAPWINYSIYTDNDAYIIPNQDLVAVGGCREDKNYDKSINEMDSKGIIERCCKICPSLKGAEVSSTWVGLRPIRSPLRIEKEVIRDKATKLTVVHNYGHCSDGIALSWGTALEAASIVKGCLQSQSKL